jgi:hypothetical protein
MFCDLSFVIYAKDEEFMQIDDTDRRLLRQALAEPLAPRALRAERAGVTLATLGRRLERLREGARRDTVVVADSFAQMAQRITSSLQGLANSIRSGDFLGILGGALDIFMQLGSAGVFGGGLQTRLNSVPGRANGGLVSSGRSYLVGERGPELFTPGATGFITPRAGNDNTRISVDASPYFDVRVNGQIVQASPAIMQGGANVAQRQMGRAQSRRVPG